MPPQWQHMSEPEPGMLMNALVGAGNLMDVPGSMLRDWSVGDDPFDQLGSLFSDENRSTGRDVLRHWGMADRDEDTWLNFLGGLGLEVAADPLNLIPFAGLPKLAKLGKAAKAAKGSNRASHVLRAKGFMPEEVARLTKAVDESGDPLKLYHSGRNYRPIDLIDMRRTDADNLYRQGWYASSAPESVAEGYTTKGMPEDIRQIYRTIFDESKVVDPSGKISMREGYELDPLARMITDEASAEFSPNTAIHYFDLRKPFDIDAMHDTSMFPGFSASTDNLKVAEWESMLDEAADKIDEVEGLSNRLSRVPAGQDVVGQRHFGLIDDIDDFITRSLSRTRNPQSRSSASGGLAQIQHSLGGLAEGGAVRDPVILKNMLAEIEEDIWAESRHISNELMEYLEKMKEPTRPRATGQEIYNYLEEKGFEKLDTDHLNALMDDIAGEGPSESQLMSDYILGSLHDKGFDSITHTGGARTGNKPHQVYIAHDPKQIYAPYIAPAIQKEQLGQRRLAAQLLGRQGLARGTHSQ